MEFFYRVYEKHLYISVFIAYAFHVSLVNFRSTKENAHRFDLYIFTRGDGHIPIHGMEYETG